VVAINTIQDDGGQKRSRTGASRRIYTSRSIAVEAANAGSIALDISIRPADGDLTFLRNAIVEVKAPQAGKAGGRAAGAAKAVYDALHNAAVEIFSRSFSHEIDEVVDAYRVMLRESLAKGEDPKLQAALNRARIQEKILASTSMVDQGEACELLGLSATNPSATMKRREDKKELLRFSIEGRAAYPLFQFDVEGRRIYPLMAQLIARKPKGWSDFRLLHWLTRPHLDFESTPGEGLADDGEAVLAAFEREIEPAVHG
jgi:hypothetical protein|tara:strand:+ start:1363 stop:2136 length:774 start_codon:yes stop_codon:yes gene_type:complete